MRTQKIKCDLPPKLCISLITSNAAKREKYNNANTLVHKLGTNLYLKDYTRLHATIHCQTGHQDNIVSDPLVMMILIQHYVSKTLKIFGEPGVAAVLK